MSDEVQAPLAAIIRRLSKPLAPQPTGIEPQLPALTGIKAVVFDVYGTLLISGSGDISLTSGVSTADAAADALSAVGIDVAIDGQSVVELLTQTVQQHHERSKSDFPEVDILAVWGELLAHVGTTAGDLTREQLERLAIEYECRANPIWPMPSVVATLATLRSAKLTLGIISNAQFFTPIAMEQLLGKRLAELGFDPPRCVWSYQHLVAKPGSDLYEQSVAGLAEQGIAPDEVLYIGNDMRNDIGPASRAGFRTVLFAGDARSLRLREEDPDLIGVEPDAVITDLSQILTILSLADG